MPLQNNTEMSIRGTKKPVIFAGTCPANSSLVLNSPLISRPFRVFRISATFALNQNRTLQLRFYVSSDNSTSTNLPLSGSNILRQAGQVYYLSGDDDTKRIEVDHYQRESNYYLKLLAVNSDAFDHTIDCIVELEIF